ncbi:MAG: SOS response-associated peptidase [Desulfobacterales bacterium]|nr:MAG: SOS response-associated peptidase [Desulfobacterales bacterium]
MSNKFIGIQRVEYFKKFYPVDRIADDKITSNDVSPSGELLAIVQKDGLNWLDRFHWGLVPSWAKSTALGSRLINARAESVAQKPSFREAFRHRRCLIPAAGFYEWAQQKNSKIPVYFKLPNGNPFAFAGLWEIWQKEDKTPTAYKSCTIITIRARGSVRKVHHRMPAVLKPEVYDTWLDPHNQDIVLLSQILKTDIITEFISDLTPSTRKARHRQLSLLE